MMSPTQVFREGAFRLSIGTPGSYGILQTQPQMLLNALEFDMNVQEAIEAPRIRVYRDRLVDAESRIDDAVRAALADRGIQTSLHYPPAHRFAIYADGALELPLTEAYAAHAITLPLFAGMTDAQQNLVVDSLAEALAA
jgi:gamma-glutamyltranspeptidase